MINSSWCGVHDYISKQFIPIWFYLYESLQVLCFTIRQEISFNGGNSEVWYFWGLNGFVVHHWSVIDIFLTFHFLLLWCAKCQGTLKRTRCTKSKVLACHNFPFRYLDLCMKTISGSVLNLQVMLEILGCQDFLILQKVTLNFTFNLYVLIVQNICIESIKESGSLSYLIFSLFGVETFWGYRRQSLSILNQSRILIAVFVLKVYLYFGGFIKIEFRNNKCHLNKWVYSFL